MGLYDDDAELVDGDLSGNADYERVTRVLDHLGPTPDAEALRTAYDRLAALTAQFPRHRGVAALRARAEAVVVPWPELARVAPTVAQLHALVREVPPVTPAELLGAHKLAAEVRHQLKWTPNLPGVRGVLDDVAATLATIETRVASGTAAAPGVQQTKLEAVLGLCTSMEVAPFGVCQACPVRLTQHGSDIVVGCELKQKLTPPLRVAFARRRGAGLLGAMTLAEHHYLFVELYPELVADERAKIDPLIDALFANHVLRA